MGSAVRCCLLFAGLATACTAQPLFDPSDLDDAGAGPSVEAAPDEEAAGGADEPPEELLFITDDIPENVDFDTARAIDVDDDVGALQQVLSDAQVDYYSFEGQAGSFYALSTNRGQFSPNTTITLYGPDRAILAENDEGSLWAMDSIDARLVARLEQDGTYYVTVDDRTTPQDYFDSGAPVLFYRFTISALDHSGPGVALADNGGSVDVQFISDEVSGFRFATLLGSPSAASQDVFVFQGGDALALIGRANASGADGNGSTSSGGVLQIADADDAVVARIDRGAGQLDIHPPVSDQAYGLRVDASAEAGDNDFYAIELVLMPDNPIEQNDDLNGHPDGADEIVMEGTRRRRGLLLAQLPAGDVDFFRFSAQQGATMWITCEAHSAGSGLRGLNVELQDSVGQVLVVGNEISTESLQLEDILAPATDDYLLKLSSKSVDSEVAAPWARCAVVVQ